MLVTGGAGFLGRAVIARLLGLGAEVHGLVHHRPLPPEVHSWPGSLPEGSEVVRTLRPQLVLHLAAEVNLRREPALYGSLRESILDATVALAAASAEVGARLVHVGTCEEYGDGPVPFHETQTPRPVSPYSALKAAAAEWVGMMGRVADLDAVVLRPFRCIGPGDRSSVVAAACQSALARRTLPLTDGRQVREWNEVAVIANAIVEVAALPEARGRTLNLGGGPRVAVVDLVKRVFELAGTDPALVAVGALPRRPGEIDLFYGDHGAANALLGPLPHPPLDETLRRTLAWWARGALE